MSVTQEELGRRLRAAREACGMTQDEVSQHLGLSRPTVAQIELGNRTVSGLELDRLAYLYGRAMGDFFQEQFEDEDVLAAIFRAHPEVTSRPEVAASLRQCLALGREVTGLERFLELDTERPMAARYTLSAPRTKMGAIVQGIRIAEDERRRLGIGVAPITEMAALLESQGVRTAVVDLPDEVSGITLCPAGVGPFVVVNRMHRFPRWAFSYAHEYAHVLLDRERMGTVSRSSEYGAKIELRANSFAASFLMPAEGVRQFMGSLGKGHESRRSAEVYGVGSVLHARGRPEPGSQDIQIYDVALLARHFGVSRICALYHLLSLRLITRPELERLKGLDETGRGQEAARILGLPDLDQEAASDAFRQRFLALALEALRREKISSGKFRELGWMAGMSTDDIERLLEDFDWRVFEVVEALLPGLPA